MPCCSADFWQGLRYVRSVTHEQERLQIEQRFAAKHGCQPLHPWSAKWPFGLDLLAKAFKYARRMQILQFFIEVLEESGTTFEQNLLGSRAIGTVDPENIEAILSTNFDGNNPTTNKNLLSLVNSLTLEAVQTIA